MKRVDKKGREGREGSIREENKKDNNRGAEWKGGNETERE